MYRKEECEEVPKALEFVVLDGRPPLCFKRGWEGIPEVLLVRGSIGGEEWG